MNPNLPASVLLLLLLMPVLAMAKSSDRNQPMEVESDRQDGIVDGDGSTILSGNVVLKQGSLDIRAAKGEIVRKNGDLSQAIFTGSQVTMKQTLDDGSPMTATADRVDYDLLKDVVVFTGNYNVKSPKGSNSGQKMVYDLKTGNIQSGGDGSRVRTVIQPKKQAGN